MAYLLIADDDEDFATAAATVLRSDGHEVHIELSIKGAAASMEQRQPDLLLLDIMFPEDPTAGLALNRKIHEAEDRRANIPVLLLTGVNRHFPLGFTEPDGDDEYVSATAFLEKPVDLDVLAHKVQTMLE